MKKTFLKIIVFFLSIFLIISFNKKSSASTKLTGIESFPDSYKPYLYELKAKYPNWEFTSLYTGLDWNTVINSEYRNDKNLVPVSYSDSWKCTDQGIYNVEIDAGWVNASQRAVEYTMDPRNFLNEVRIFQFEKLTYDTNINNQAGVEKILYGTEFYEKLVSYKTASGEIINTATKYSDLIMAAAQYSGVSPYHLASRIKQEVGPFLSHNSISGTVAGFEGLYNFYNIGATSATTVLGAIKNGLQYALNGKNALTTDEFNNQLLPWNTPEKAIKGGAVFIGKSYILVGQNNLYLQKFDVNDDRGSSILWHQYMTNCLAPYNECKSIYNAYSSSGLINSSIGFVIPVYENMPTYATSSPNINESDFQSDNTKCYADVTTTLNVRNGPGTSYESITQIGRTENFTRIGKGVQNGERWDKILLTNGIVGYVFQTYVAEATLEEIEKDVNMESIVLDKISANLIIGKSIKLNANVLPDNTTNKTIVWSSENEDVAIVTQDGTVTAVSEGNTKIWAKSEDGLIKNSCDIVVSKIQDGVYLEFDQTININGDELSGFPLDKLKISEFKKLIDTNLNLEFYNHKDELLSDDDFVGTGSKLIVKNSENIEIYRYVFVVYGDLNGDGEINSLDVLVVQKYILELKTMTGVFLKAGNINKNGSLPSALDVLKIQKHILEINKIF